MSFLSLLFVRYIIISKNHDKFASKKIIYQPIDRAQLKERWADSINMWPNAVGKFNRPFFFCCIYENVDEKYFLNLQILK